MRDATNECTSVAADSVSSVSVQHRLRYGGARSCRLVREHTELVGYALRITLIKVLIFLFLTVNGEKYYIN